jgi:nucleotide-binding universal stress UspA family protein
MKIEKILLPTSGLRHAEMMAELAVDIARLHNASITALYVIEIPMHLPVDAQLPEEVKKGEEATHKIQQIGKPHAILVNAKVVNARKVSDAVLEEAELGKYDLIMLGVSSRKLLRKFFFGDAVNEVIKKAPCMVCVGKCPATE